MKVEKAARSEQERVEQETRNCGRVGASRGWAPFSRPQYEHGRGKEGAYLFGDANEAVDKILHMHEMFGLTRFSAHMDVGGPSHAMLMKSIEIFGKHIAPRVRAEIRK